MLRGLRMLGFMVAALVMSALKRPLDVAEWAWSKVRRRRRD